VAATFDGQEAFSEGPVADVRSGHATLSEAPWGARHASGQILYYPEGISAANLVLHHHLIGVELLPHFVSVGLDGGNAARTIVPSASFYVVPAGAQVVIRKSHVSEHFLITVEPAGRPDADAQITFMREQLRNPELTRAALRLRREVLLNQPTERPTADVVDAAFRALRPTGAGMRPMVGAPDARVLRALEVAAEGLSRKLSVEQVATEAGFGSGVRLAHVFSALLGISLHQYVMQLRVHRARALLLESDMSIAEVAYDTGFSSQAHMTESFRRRVGTSPARLRLSPLAER